MLYDIDLKIRYDYEHPALGGRQLLRLTPLNIDGAQRVISKVVTTNPKPAERHDRIDFFENDVVELAYDQSHKNLQFGIRARVERLHTAPRLELSTPLERISDELASLNDLSSASPHHFTSPSARVDTLDVLTNYARDIVGQQHTTLGAVQAIGEALYGDMTFDADATTVDTRPEEAFERRHGVCQDFTHIMIACLRGIGIPAGYVSGFLRTLPPEGQPKLEGVDAMHAWVRAWCGKEFGWLEFDPTNNLMVDSDHIVVAYGRDYADVAPVLGTLRVSGTQTSKQSVTVRALS